MPKESAITALGMIGALHPLIPSPVWDATMARFSQFGPYTEADVDWIYARSLELQREYDNATAQPNGLKIMASVDLTPPMSRDEIAEFLEEERQGILLCGGAESDCCDLPWRIPLSLVLREVPEHEERVRLLDLFFAIFGEYWEK